MTPRIPIGTVPRAVSAVSVPYTGVTGAPTSLPPSGTAGGALADSYPNPTLAANAVDNAKLASDAASLNKVSAGAISAASGKIGVGTLNPASRLTVMAETTSSDNTGNQVLIQGATDPNRQLLLGYNTIKDYGTLQSIHQNGGVTPLILQPLTGNVGIQTTTPAAALDVNGSIYVRNGIIRQGGVAITATSDLGLYNSNAGWMRFVNNGGPFQFFSDYTAGTSATPASNSTAMSVTGAGVGIGQPTRKRSWTCAAMSC